MTKLLGIIGYPLAHSISPAFQQAAFDFYSLDVSYEAWETPHQDLESRVRALANPDTLGANVTVPHKESVCPFLDRNAEWVRFVGAVNTIVNRDGLLVGYNTDTQGFLRALKEDGAFEPRGMAVLLLGAGGAARAVAFALEREQVASITVANRTVERAQMLVRVLQPWLQHVQAIPLTPEALAKVAPKADVIINCTSLGMKHSPSESQTSLTADVIPPGALVYDLVYNPEETPLLREAQKAGARTLGGLPMLVYQGATSFKLWTGKDAPLEVMFAAARKALDYQEGNE